MIDFFIYSANGKILMTGQCAPGDLALQTIQNSMTRAGVAVLGKHQVADSGELTEIPTQPSEHHLFNYDNKQWEDPRTRGTEWALVRAQRDDLLVETDWVVTKALELGGTVSAAWKTYRKALRDITMQPDPFAVVWPVLPP